MNSTQTLDKFTEKGTRIATMIISALAVEGIEARLDIVYRDYGQNWLWETVIVHATDNSSSYQALNPRQFEAMNSGDFNYAEINEIVAEAKRLTSK